MQKGALKGIGDVIKAHTTEKSLDELRAQGKKRVRVVSGQRVMEIIQAIVDDTIDREVGEIAKRDRDRIVGDTRERFSRVLKMQTGLEQTVAELRSELRETDLERERLKADKGFLEQQVESARKAAGEPEAVSRLGKDIDRLRESVEEIHRRVSTADEAAIGRAIERLTTRDEQNARRLATELDDVRKRIDGVARDTARSKDAATEVLLDRMSELQRHSDEGLAKRLESEFLRVHQRIDELREQVEGADASDAALDRLRGDLDALENRMHGVETSSEELAQRISAAVAVEIVALRDELAASRSDVQAASADALTDVEHRLGERVSAASDVLSASMADLMDRVSAIDERTGNAVESVAERVAERVVIDEGALTDAVARVASRVDQRIDEITNAVAAADERRADEVRVLREDIVAAAADHAGIDAALDVLAERQDARLGDAVTTLGAEWSGRHDALVSALHDGIARLDGQLTAVAERAAAVDVSLPGRLEAVLEGALTGAMGGVRDELAALHESSAQAQAAAPAALEQSLGAVRDEMAAVRDELGAITSRAVESESGLRDTVHEAVSSLRAELEALAERLATAQSAATETAARQEDALRAMREEFAAAAAAQSGAMSDRFENALEGALDKITRTMEAATARPIEISVEATDVLLDKIFDAGDEELTSNLGQLEVEQRSGNGIARSLGKLRALRAPSRNGTED